MRDNPITQTFSKWSIKNSGEKEFYPSDLHIHIQALASN